jgi:hypothetical protein
MPLIDEFSTTKTTHIETTKIYEENASFIILAKNDGTKHIYLKWHHFKDHLQSGAFKIVKISSNLNWVDIFSKPLSKAKHESLCKCLMGW